MAVTYKLTPTAIIARTTTGTDEEGNPTSVNAYIPPDARNGDYREYLAWVAAGNTPDPADPTPLVFNNTVAVANRLTTADATPTQIMNAPLAQNTGYFAKFTLIAVDTGNGNVKTIVAHIGAKRLGAGALLVGTPVILSSINDAGASAWTATASVSGSNFVVTVTGAIGRTIAWALSADIISFTPAGR